MLVDFDTVDPRGRLDVMAYRGAEFLTNHFAEKVGLQGVWDVLKPQVAKLVSQHVTPYKLPIEGQLLLGIIQANYQRPKVEG